MPFTGEYVASVKAQLTDAKAGCGGAPVEHATRSRSERAYRDMPKRTCWQYLTMPAASLELLNAVGKDGWELIGLIPVLMPTATAGEESAEPMLLFKREREGRK